MGLKIEWLYLVGGILLAVGGMFILGGRDKLRVPDIPLKQMSPVSPASTYPALSGDDDMTTLPDLELYQYDKASNPDDAFNYSANESLRMYNRSPLGGFLNSANSRQLMLYRPLENKMFKNVQNSNQVWSGMYGRSSR